MSLVENPQTTLLVGHGYWGKIIEKNLLVKPKIFDIINPKESLDELLKNATHVIIATPAETHFDIILKCLKYNCKIFCEKPLTPSYEDTVFLYKKAEELNKTFFVDWIFLNNAFIKYIKSLIDNGTLGKLNHASFNRLNLGPARSDVSARHDLTSHDISILSFLLKDQSLNVEHVDFFQTSEKVAGTCYTKISWCDGNAVLNSSWNYPNKNRTCVFSFENATIHWDDFLGISTINGKKFISQQQQTPLQVSLSDFFDSTFNFEENKKITLSVSKLINL